MQLLIEDHSRKDNFPKMIISQPMTMAIKHRQRTKVEKTAGLSTIILQHTIGEGEDNYSTHKAIIPPTRLIRTFNYVCKVLRIYLVRSMTMASIDSNSLPFSMPQSIQALRSSRITQLKKSMREITTQVH